jgi:hypothetical protein
MRLAKCYLTTPYHAVRLLMCATLFRDRTFHPLTLPSWVPDWSAHDRCGSVLHEQVMEHCAYYRYGVWPGGLRQLIKPDEYPKNNRPMGQFGEVDNGNALSVKGSLLLRRCGHPFEYDKRFCHFCQKTKDTAWPLLVTKCYGAEIREMHELIGNEDTVLFGMDLYNVLFVLYPCPDSSATNAFRLDSCFRVEWKASQERSDMARADEEWWGLILRQIQQKQTIRVG